MAEIVRRRKWSEAELRSEGFHYYERQKQLVMAARIPEQLGPIKIVYELETVVAQVGDVLCFDPGTRTQRKLMAYDYWSVKPTIFRKTYRTWDDDEWMPTPPQAHLVSFGCRPYFKFKGAWAKHLRIPTVVQSVESPMPIQVPAGAWLIIGEKGEPWHSDADTFARRYIVESTAQLGG